jgi:hypothetical protein
MIMHGAKQLQIYSYIFSFATIEPSNVRRSEATAAMQ